MDPRSPKLVLSLCQQKAHLVVGDDMFPLHTLTFLCSSYWCTHVSLPVAICCREASPSQYHCRNCVHVSTCAHLCSSTSYFGTHLAQILWYPIFSWLMEYADPQLMSNLLAISVIITHLSSWIRVFTCSKLSAICEVVRWPKWSSLTMLVLPLRIIFTHCYTPLCIIQFSPYCANFLLWMSWAFTPLWVQKLKDSTFLNNGAIQKQSLDVLHYGFMSVTKCNSYPHDMPRLSLVCSMHDVHKSAVWHITRILHTNCPPPPFFFYIPFVY